LLNGNGNCGNCVIGNRLILVSSQDDIDPALIIQSQSPSTVISLEDQSVRQTKGQ